MNERIRLLAKQATLKWAEEVPGGVQEMEFFDKEKFAELIVQECIGVVNKTDPPGYNDYPDYRDQIEQAFRSECATEIKKHFGVE